MKIPMLDLYAQYLTIKKDVDSAIANVIRDTAFISGKYVEKFEQELGDYCDTKYAVGLNSGTDALYLALKALNIGAGDEVITSPFSFFATAETIMMVGARPVFVDVDPLSYNINPDLIEQKITNKTKAIIPVHLFGLSADMDKINRIARIYKLYVIEDACQAIGATYKNKKTGSLGDIGCFSFFPSKNLGAYGDGGAVTTNSLQIANKIRMLRNHGSITKYKNETVGINSRLDGIQTAILSVKLKYLNKWIKNRQTVASQYNKLFKNIDWIQTPINVQPTKATHSYHQYTIRVKNKKRNQIKKQLEQKQIASMIYYPIPLHLLKPLRNIGYKTGDFPIAEKAADEVLSLPIYPEMNTNIIENIAKSILSLKLNK